MAQITGFLKTLFFLYDITLLAEDAEKTAAGKETSLAYVI